MMSESTKLTAAVLTVEETATYLHLSRSSIYAAIRCREIPAVRIGSRLLIPKAALVAMLEGAEPDGR